MMFNMKKLISTVMAVAIMLSLFVMPVAEAAGTMSGWNIGYNGGAKAKVSLDNTQSADGEVSLKTVNNSAAVGNVYVMINTPVNLESGKEYKVSMKAKSELSSIVNVMFSWGGTQSLVAFGRTFDWRNFEWYYTPTTTKQFDFQIVVEGETKGFWIDDVKVIDVSTGKNLITNSSFEEVKDVVEAKPNPEQNNGEIVDYADSSVQEIYDKVSNSDSFTEEEMLKVRGAFKYMPVYRTESISVDGNGDDWESFPEMTLPTLPSQYIVYKNDGLAKDVVSTAKFAYDGGNFYLYIEVEDDKFVSYQGENEYWKGDSIQLAISSTDETYGNEIGFRHNPETGEGEVYGSGFNAEQKRQIELSTKQEGNTTVYEARIPWSIKYNNRPSQIYFNYLVNDNDGSGRRYCVELAPKGISELKSNQDCPLLELQDNQKSWYGWIQGDRKGLLGEETSFEWYLLNSEDQEKTFTVRNSITNTDEKYTVPGKTGIRHKINYVFDTKGGKNISISFSADGEEMLSSTNIDISRRPPTKEAAEVIQKEMVLKADEIKALLDKCADASIDTDYETVNWNVMNRFAQYMADDISREEFTRIYYTEEVIVELYEEAKTNLNAYLVGEKTPFVVPHYITSDITFDGPTAYATNEVNGEYEKRPTFFVGYIGYGTPRGDIPVFNGFGANAIQQEAGPNQVMKNQSGWLTTGSGDGLPKVSKEDVKEGKKAFITSYTLPKQENRFTTTYYTVTGLEEGKEYVLKGWAKAKNANETWVSANNWDKRLYLNGTYDWKEFSTTFVADGKTSTIIRINTDAPTEMFMLDGLTLTDSETRKNYFEAGNFETFDSYSYVLDMTENGTFDQYCKMLENAEKHNVSVSALISPHYFFDDVIQKENLKMSGPAGGTLKFNVNSDVVRDILEQYLSQVIPIIAGYKSVSNICISNEPHFYVDTAVDNFYLEPWQEFLKEVYGGDIQKLNSVWGTEYISFTKCNFEGYQYNLAKNYDYKEFNDKALGEFHKWFADTIKKYAPDMPVHAKIMQYIGEAPSGRSNNGTGYLHNYEAFDLNGSDAFNMIVYENGRGELRKNMWYDYQRSYQDVPAINSEDHISEDGNIDYRRDAADYMAQDIYQGAIHGRFMSTIWVWQRYVTGQPASFIGSVLHRPDAVAQIGKANLDLNRLSYYIEALQKETPDVGIIYSDADYINYQTVTHATYQAYAGCVYNGKNVRFVTDANPSAMHNYKLVIVPCSRYVSIEMLNALNEYVNNGGKVIIMGTDKETLSMDKRTFKHDESVVNNIKSKAHIIEYSGSAANILNMKPEEFHAVIRNKLKEFGLYYVSVVDAKTGEIVNHVECNIGVENGKVIVNLSNNGDTKDVKVYLGDRLIKEAVELRSGQMVNENITIEKYMPITLEVDTDYVFFDTYGHWAEDCIASLYKQGVIKGKSESRYDPNGFITRWEFHALLSRACGFELDEYNTESEEFRPNDKITREEMSEMLVKYYEAEKGQINADAKHSFVDVINNEEVILKVASAELMQGRGNNLFAPYEFATRAEAATVILRYMEK